jgi:hypothetical protein
MATLEHAQISALTLFLERPSIDDGAGETPHMLVLWESPFHQVSRLVGTSVVHLQRLDAPFASIEEMREEMGHVIAVLDALSREHFGLLVDVRIAPARNDTEFENAMAPMRLRAITGFRKIAMLASTRVGALQLVRYSREDGQRAQVFQDVRLALSWLRTTE